MEEKIRVIRAKVIEENFIKKVNEKKRLMNKIEDYFKSKTR